MVIDTRYFNRTEPTLPMFWVWMVKQYCMNGYMIQKMEPIEDEV